MLQSSTAFCMGTAVLIRMTSFSFFVNCGYSSAYLTTKQAWSHVHMFHTYVTYYFQIVKYSLWTISIHFFYINLTFNSRKTLGRESIFNNFGNLIILN